MRLRHEAPGAASSSTGRAAGLPGRRLGVAALGVLVLAVAVRLAAILRDGGLTALPVSYDPSVYYAAAQSLVLGRLPYRDFLLLHPPGAVLALSPFALVAQVTGDPAGLALARVTWAVVGGLVAALVVVLARRHGLGAAVAGGAAYALLPPVVGAETAPLLEPLASLCLLGGMALLSRADAATRHRVQVAAGAALGLCLTVKIWDVVPVAVVLGWAALRLGRRATARVTLAAGAAAAAVCLPFLAVAPGAATRMVLLDQLGRGGSGRGTWTRLQRMLGLPEIFAADRVDHLGVLADAVAALAVLALVGLAVLAWTRRDARLLVVLAAAQVAVLLASPSYFTHYASFTAPALALVLAAGVGVLLDRAAEPAGRPGRRALRAVVVTGVVVALAGAASGDRRLDVGTPFPAAALRPAVADARCVSADTPALLVGLDVLSRDLRRGCAVAVDLTGLTYDRDALPLRPDGSAVARPQNPRWQRNLLAHLESGDATILGRPGADGLSAASARTVAGWPVLARQDGWVLRAPRPSTPSASPPPG